jgi:hypothetical protein
MLRQAWDSGDIRTLTKEPLHATGTHISMVGHITKLELIDRLSTTEAANGFGNRILWACATRSRVLPHGGTLDAESLTYFADLLRGVLNWLNSQACPIRVMWDDEAKTLWESLYGELSEGKSGLFGAVTSRAEAYVVRLALIYALVDCSPVISEEHLLAALAVWKYCESSAKFIFGDATGNPVADTILKALRDTAEGLTRSEISGLFDRNKTAATLETALTLLAGEGRAKQVRDLGRPGRPPERWVAVGA